MNASPDRTVEAPSREAARPAWLMSVVAHAVVVLFLGWMLRVEPRGTSDEPGRPAGIVLKRVSDEGETFEGEDDAQPDAAASTAVAAAVSDVVEALPTEAAGIDPASALPAMASVIGPGSLESGGVGGADALADGSGPSRTLAGGAARVKVYGLEGEGSKFVFVFDRSDSMAGAPLASAKGQLLGGLVGLESTHQFQIIFFNHQPRVFDISGTAGRIPFATEPNKRLAERFVRGISATGGTNRYAALSEAVRMRPDVIFFLSDADDPMSPRDMDRIERLNRGIAAIQVIEFGFGPSPGGDNFLKRLARANGGGFTYVDIGRLGR